MRLWFSDAQLKHIPELLLVLHLVLDVDCDDVLLFCWVGVKLEELSTRSRFSKFKQQKHLFPGREGKQANQIFQRKFPRGKKNPAQWMVTSPPATRMCKGFLFLSLLLETSMTLTVPSHKSELEFWEAICCTNA